MKCTRCYTGDSALCRIRDGRADYFCLTCSDMEWQEDNRKQDLWMLEHQEERK